MVKIVSSALREYHLWRQYGIDRLRWLFRYRFSPLSTQTFTLDGIEFPYFVHPYNHTWANERAVEIPVVRHFLAARRPSSRLLEVGNVLSHYFDIESTVLDLKEKCRYRPVINQDVTSYCPPHAFSTIVSISTLEHVGWDENPRNEEKVMESFAKLRSFMGPGSRALITVPVGYNLFLDERLRDRAILDARFHCLRRISEDNEWIETSLEEALTCKYGQPFETASAVVFIWMENGTGSDRAME